MAQNAAAVTGPRVFRMSAKFVADMLGSDLYENRGACLWEIVRNGACACMPDPHKWSPERARLEISLTDQHPLASNPNSKTLSVFDRGSGFTEPNMQTFFQIGPDEEAGGEGSKHRGASEKRIGKFAAFALNRAILNGVYTGGFFILTRTASSGDVMFMEVTPNSVAKGTTTPRYIKSDSAELGAAYRNVKGSFALIVIPNCVFSTLEEIREELKWFLPRKKDRAIHVTVGGKLLAAPELCSATDTFGEIQAFLGRRKAKDGQGGIWLTDAETGLRCAFAPGMGVHMPYPLGRPDLEGDIFIPGLLENQGTDRSGLKASFMRGKAWRERIYPMLLLRVVPFALELLGEDDIFRDNPHDKQLREIADMFAGRWGQDAEPPPPKGPRPSGGGGGGGGKPPVNPGTPPDDPQRPRALLIPIDGKIYRLRKGMTLDPHVFAELSGSDIFLNEKYAAWPEAATAVREHMIMGLLFAVASGAHTWDTREALKRSTALRAALLQKK